MEIPPETGYGLWDGVGDIVEIKSFLDCSESRSALKETRIELKRNEKVSG